MGLNMFWYAKVIGAVLGFFVAGPFGAFVGLVAGHFFDKGLASFSDPQAHQHIPQGSMAEVQEQFFVTVFSVMGNLAKADGRVSEQEIAQIEVFFDRLGLSAEHRTQAIGLFKEGATPGYDIDPLLFRFSELAIGHEPLKELCLVFLITLALADDELHHSEEAILRAVAHALGYAPNEFESMLRSIVALQRFRAATGGTGSDGGADQRRHSGYEGERFQDGQRLNDLALAYEALGVTEEMSDTDIKRAYRRLMSKFHPDKLIAEGVPDDMLKLGTQKAQEVQSAYDLIKKSRQRANGGV
jgi:DnaJ like chaperone protein